MIFYQTINYLIIWHIYIFVYRFEGKLVQKAKFLNIPIVNVQWINDILLGENIGIEGANNAKYRKFDLYDPFSMNHGMVSELMSMLYIN